MIKKKILIMEDDSDLAKALNKRLRASSYDTVQADSTVIAIEKAYREKPDLIILDISVPGNGFVVKEMIKKSRYLSSIPIIIITAMNSLGNDDRSIKSGVAAFFQKPFDEKKLLRVVKKVLGEPVQGKKE